MSSESGIFKAEQKRRKGLAPYQCVQLDDLRTRRLDELFEAEGRGDRGHPLVGTYTGLAQASWLAEAQNMGCETYEAAANLDYESMLHQVTGRNNAEHPQGA